MKVLKEVITQLSGKQQFKNASSPNGSLQQRFNCRSLPSLRASVTILHMLFSHSHIYSFNLYLLTTHYAPHIWSSLLPNCDELYMGQAWV